MAYTPINWQTGDTITAEKMNKMDNGWGIQESQLFSETVTTVAGEYGNEAVLTYSTPITADSITVMFNGNSYICPAISIPSESAVGFGGVDSNWSYDFTQYPFAIVSGGNVNYIATQTAGTHTVTASGASLQISTNFSNAVNACTIPQVVLAVSNFTTWQEVYDAVSSGKIVCILADEADYKTMRFVANVGISSGGNYHIETIMIQNNAVDVASYYANAANDPIYPN